jgi:tetratricopeptide (TPR) repeat protein
VYKKNHHPTIYHHRITHHYIRCGMALLFLSQSFPVQAAAYKQDTQEASPTQPLQNLPTLIQALEKQQEKHGKKPHDKTAKTLENIGNAYIKQHNYQQGLAYYKKALKMTKALYGKSPHIEVANALKNVGFAHLQLIDNLFAMKKR